jgi:hypothetical protein
MPPLRSLRGALSGARVLLLLLAFAAIFATPARAAEPGIVPDMPWGTAAEEASTESAIHDMGARWVRLPIRWSEAERQRGVYDKAKLAEYDRAVAASRRSGAKVLLMVYEAPAWSSGSASSNVPRDPADYARFMSFLAARYAGQVDAYEIWNEEGHSRFWSTGRDPVAYTALLKLAYRAVKAADANATVVLGGLSSYDYQFLDDVYAAGGKGYFDAVGLHPYTDCGIPPGTLWYDANGRLFGYAFLGYREVHRRMVELYGDDKPIWFTEFGWTTTTEKCGSGAWTSGVDEAQQAANLKRAFALLDQDDYVKVAIVYMLRNAANDHDDVETRFGILHHDFSPKPAYTAFKAIASGAAAASTPAPEPTATPTPVTPAPSPTPTPTSTPKPHAKGPKPRVTIRTARRSGVRQLLVSGRVGATAARVDVQVRRRSRGAHASRVLNLARRAHASGRFRLRHRLPHGRWSVRAAVVAQGHTARIARRTVRL